jgi:hypothetical protein
VGFVSDHRPELKTQNTIGTPNNLSHFVNLWGWLNAEQAWRPDLTCKRNTTSVWRRMHFRQREWELGGNADKSGWDG